MLRPGTARWESACVYNPAAIVHDDRVVLLYRAHADDIVSSIGLAWSDDGLHFEREAEPVLWPEHDYEKYGCEDPRVVRVDDTFFLTYTGWDRSAARLCLATSTDLRNWTKHGPMLPGLNTFAGLRTTPEAEWSKGGVILETPVDGRYLMWVGEGNVYVAESSDLVTWRLLSDEPVLRPSPGTFMGDLVETGPQPVLTRTGHVLLMHNSAIELPEGGVYYACGQVLIDPAEPTVPVAALLQPWLEPTTDEDRHGLVDNVTFVEGLVFHRRTWFAYYGQSDTTVGVATFTPHPDAGQRTA
ncbi:glycoside hydrolase family 130 protein [Aestuariimicrobium soli]|uniref:glycoside hydrolase family 130 protein n=1 Tax=Aestuariimicrobium soli TaxID=2035834 RepID=UPI003EBF6824